MKEKFKIPEIPKEPESKSEIKTEGFHRIAKERQKLRGEFLEEEGEPWNEKKKEEEFERVPLAEQIRRIKEGAPEDILKVGLGGKNSLRAENLANLDKQASAFSLKNKKQVKGLREEREEEREFEKVSVLLQALDKTEDDLLAKEYEISTKSAIDSSDKIALEKLASVGLAVSERRHSIENNPETALFARMHELRRYQKELASGFAETPLRKADMDWVREKWERGRAVLLEGSTGTGKTEMITALTKKLYGKPPEIVRCTERTGPPEIFGKVLLKAGPLGATETFFQPGRYTAAIESGLPILFDEFNQLPTNTRFALKELYNRKAGDQVIIQEDTGKPHIIKRGFAWAATANIKSGKHKERFELDGAESRVFAIRHLDFIPKHELYDLCLAKLADEYGGAEISKEEALSVLKNFCDAAEEIQNGYDKEIGEHYGKTSLKGEKPKLLKAVLDPGAALEALSGFRVSRSKGMSLKAHLEKELSDFLGKRDYPDSDRDLIARILVAKGFFAEREAKDFGIKGLDERALSALKGAAKKGKEREFKESKKLLTLKELAALDPYGLRKQAHLKGGEEFLKSKPERKEKTKSAESGESVSLERAREIMGENFLGPEAVINVFGVELDIPIRCSEEDLERARELNQILILDIDKMEDGKPMTIENMKSKFPQSSDGGKMWCDQSWYNKEDFFKNETPRAGWKLVSKEIIPGLTNKNYLEQTEIIVNYIKEKVFKDKPIPDIYQEAIDEFESQKSDIAEIIDSDWKKATNKLEKLQITPLARENPAEVNYRLILQDQENKEKLLPLNYTWTLRRASDGKFVYAGSFDSDGADLNRNTPDNRNVLLGVSFSRSL